MAHGIIYQYTNTLTGLVYVGQTKHPAKRRRTYAHEVASTRPNPRCIIQAMRQVGLKAFTYQILAEATTVDDLNRLEIHYIAALQANNPQYGYNRTEGGQTSRGRTVSDETKAKMSLAHRSRTFSAEHKANIRRANSVRIISDETRAKLSLAGLGKTHSDETKAKISSGNRGKIVSAETKAKMSQAHRGRTKALPVAESQLS